MKVSRYTLFEKYGDKILLFNSLTGKLAFVDWEKDLYNWLNGSNSNYEILKDYSELKTYGFIVEDCYEENIIANLKKHDYIYENTLKLEIIPTLFCNFDCPYCYEHHNSDFMNKNIQNALKKFISKNLLNYSAIQIFWFGGEPLLAKDFIVDFSTYVKQISQKYSKKYMISIVTNGYLLSRDIFDELYAAGVRCYQITFDGSQIYHDKKRFLKNGSGSYETILNNLLDIRSKKGFYHFNLRCNITKENCEDISNFLITMNSKFADDSRFKLYFRPVGDWGGDSVKKIKNQLLDGNYDIYKALLKSNCESLNYGLQYLWVSKFGICESNQRNYYVINPYGELLKCTKHLDNPNNKIGYIDESGNLVLYEEILAYWLCNSIKEKSDCLNCKSYANCYGVQCPISDHINCEYSEQSAKQFLILQYQCNNKNFIKI